MNQYFSFLLNGSADEIMGFIKVLFKVSRGDVILVDEHVLILILKLWGQTSTYSEYVGNARSSQREFILTGLVVSKPDVLGYLVLRIDF